MNESKVLYVGAFRFPEGDAAASRVLMIGKALKERAVDSVYLSWGSFARIEDRDYEGRFHYQGFQYSALDEFRRQKVPLLLRIFNYFLQGNKTLLAINELENNQITAIIAYHGNCVFLSRLIYFCWKRKIPLTIDCTEWYESSALPGGKYGPVSVDNWLRMHVINRLIDRKIVISNYLKSYYGLNNKRVIRVPALVDTRILPFAGRVLKRDSGAPLNLVYAGFPGKKDKFDDLMKAVVLMVEEELPINLDIYGPSETDLESIVSHGIWHKVKDFISVKGRVSQAELFEVLPYYDFSVIIRQHARYSRAGFPTKLVESLAAGVPVICSAVGDASLYIVDDVNGYNLPVNSCDEIFELFKRISKKTDLSLFEMKKEAKKTALEQFSYHLYTDKIAELVLEG